MTKRQTRKSRKKNQIKKYIQMVLWLGKFYHTLDSSENVKLPPVIATDDEVEKETLSAKYRSISKIFMGT